MMDFSEVSHQRLSLILNMKVLNEVLLQMLNMNPFFKSPSVAQFTPSKQLLILLLEQEHPLISHCEFLPSFFLKKSIINEKPCG